MTDYVSDDAVLDASVLHQRGRVTSSEPIRLTDIKRPDSSWTIPSSLCTVEPDEQIEIFVSKAGSLPIGSSAAGLGLWYWGMQKASSPFYDEWILGGNFQAFTVSVASFSAGGNTADEALYDSCGLYWTPRTHVYQDIRRQVSQLYLFHDFPIVDRYLTNNYSLQDLLVETYFHLVEFFGSDATFELELMNDEYDPRERQLYLLIHSRRPADEQMSALENFEEEWWFERSGQIINGPVITLK